MLRTAVKAGGNDELKLGSSYCLLLMLKVRNGLLITTVLCVNEVEVGCLS